MKRTCLSVVLLLSTLLVAVGQQPFKRSNGFHSVMLLLGIKMIVEQNGREVWDKIRGHKM